MKNTYRKNHNDLAKEGSNKMRIAWLVQWGCHAQNEAECLKRSGIKEKVVDVISVRKDFDKQIIDIAKDIYKRGAFSFSEKVYLSNYSLGEKRKKEFFGGRIPVFTHYQSDLYRNLMRATQEKGLDHEETRKLSDQWGQSPQYITVGHNPYLEIIKVFNLSVYEDKSGNEIIEWERPLANGNLQREKYEFKK